VNIVDLFAGPGGWSLALRSLGMDDDLGVENNPRAVETRDAIGLTSLEADVRDIPSDAFGDIDGLIASPPCQSFSAAGKQLGLDDPRGDLVWQPRRFIETTLPDWIAFEEVKEVLPIWKHYTHWLRGIGYSAWSGILNAADYGVPQSRKRAILIANRNHPVGPPPPTHSPSPHDDLFGAALRPWVTMAQALPHRDDLPDWCHQRPATTVVRSFCPHIIAAPGWRGPGDGPRQNTPDSVEVDIDEMATLQGAPTGLPFAGPKTSRFSLCGALFPPPMAAAVIRAASVAAIREAA
jgi:DNA (cytosine-5)-methyltransferase 1